MIFIAYILGAALAVGAILGIQQLSYYIVDAIQQRKIDAHNAAARNAR